MNGGAIENNAATAFGGGICFDASDYGGMVPKIELNAGTIKNNLRQVTVTVNDEYQITGGISNDLAVTGKDYGKCDRYLYISREQLLEIGQFISRLTVRPLPRLTAALTSGWGTPVLQM